MNQLLYIDLEMNRRSVTVRITNSQGNSVNRIQVFLDDAIFSLLPFLVIPRYDMDLLFLN